MSKALLWIFLLMFASIVLLMSANTVNANCTPDTGTVNCFQIPAYDSPTYCTGFQATVATPAGTTPYYSSFGAIPADYLDYTTHGLSTGAIELSMVALLLSFATIAIAYALSRMFPHLGIRNWLQGEYWEVTKTVILLAVIFAVITIISNITYAFLTPVKGGTAPTPATVGDITPLLNGAETYLCNVNYELTNTWGWMGLLGSGTGFWSNLKLGVYDTIPIPPYIALIGGSVLLPFNNWMLQTGNPMIAPYGSIIGDTINLLLFPFTLITVISIDALPSMALIGLLFFIPMGLLFRAFPFVRGIGGTLVAIGFGMAVVFPAVLIVFNGVFMNYLQQAIAINPPPVAITTTDIDSIAGFNEGSGQLTFPADCPFNLGSGAFGLVGQAFCDTSMAPMAALVPQLVPPIIFAASDEANTNNPGGNPAGYLNGANVFSDVALYQYMDIILSTGSYIIVQLMLTTIDLVLVYTITDSIARSLGGSIRFQLGGKLRIAS